MRIYQILRLLIRSPYNDTFTRIKQLIQRVVHSLMDSYCSRTVPRCSFPKIAKYLYYIPSA